MFSTAKVLYIWYESKGATTVFHWLDTMLTMVTITFSLQKTEQVLCEFDYYKPSPSSYDVVL